MRKVIISVLLALFLAQSVAGVQPKPLQIVEQSQFKPIQVPSPEASFNPSPSFRATPSPSPQTRDKIEVREAKPKTESKIKPTPTAVNGKQPSRAKIKAWTRAKLGNDTQFACLDKLWWKESAWRWNAGHPSRAYGIPQAYPGTKMKREGADWKTNPITQVNWGLKYIKRTYGTPCNAWNHWKKVRSY